MDRLSNHVVILRRIQTDNWFSFGLEFYIHACVLTVSSQSMLLIICALRWGLFVPRQESGHLLAGQMFSFQHLFIVKFCNKLLHICLCSASARLHQETGCQDEALCCMKVSLTSASMPN